MIHKNSTDPVLVKKIYLNVWTLKDEIKAVLNKKQQSEPGSFNQEETEAIREEYRYKGPPSKDEASFQLIEGGKDSEEGQTETAQAQEEEGQKAESENQAEDSEEAPSNPTTVIQRTSITLPNEKITRGMCILSELGMDHFHFFSNKAYLEGQSIVLEFLIPKKFVLNAEVTYCRAFNMKSRIIGENKLPFRIAARFTFLKSGERTLLRQFVKSVEPELPIEPTPIKSAEEVEDGENETEAENLEEAEV